MTDYYSCLRGELSRFCSAVLFLHIPAHTFSIARRNCAARCAIPLKSDGDIEKHAQALRDSREQATLFNAPLVEDVRQNGGHLLFTFTELFYTHALRLVLQEQPRALPLLPLSPAANSARIDELRSMVAYTQRRMWMLARKARETDPLCPSYKGPKQALLLCMGLVEQGRTDRAMYRRAEEACSALLRMSYTLMPRERPQFLRRCAHVGDAASRLLYQWNGRYGI